MLCTNVPLICFLVLWERLLFASRPGGASRDSKIIGKLHNISQGGLAFQYAPIRSQKVEIETIDIMAKSPDPFYLPGVDCRTVYDISALVENRTFTGAATRLSGVQFVRLNKEQEQKLALFIKKYGLEPIDDPG